jgi:hypothetical protein
MPLVNRPEDRLKVIALCVAIAVVLIYTGVTVVPRLMRSPQAAPATPSMPGAEAGGGLAGGTQPPADSDQDRIAGIREMNQADIDVESGTPPAATRDPFKPPVPTAVAPPPGTPRATGPTAPGTTGQRGGARAAQNFVLPPGPGPTYTQFPGGTLVAPVAPPPTPLIELKGVIPGEPAIAVMTVDGRTVHRQEGERLEGGLVVAKITETGVVLKQGRKNYSLDVGQSVKPAPAPAPGNVTPAPAPKNRGGVGGGGAAPLRAVPAPSGAGGNPESFRGTGASPAAATTRPATGRRSATHRRSIRHRRLRHRRPLRYRRHRIRSAGTRHYTGRRL